MVDEVQEPKPARKRRASTPRKKPQSNAKTLIVAVAALLTAAADLFLTLRMGIKLF